MKKPTNIQSFLLCVSILAVACDSPGAPSEADGRRSKLPAAGASGSDSLPTPESDGVDRSHRTELTDTEPASIVDFVGRPLCRFVRHPGYRGHGLYEVTALTAYLEQVGDDEVAATYVELKLLQDFHRADEKVVARISGGPLRDGSIAAWSLPLELGETVAVLGVVKPFESNLGYPTLDPTHVLRQRPEGGYTNGALFTRRTVDADELGELVAGLAGGDLNDACAYDVEPDNDRPVNVDRPALPGGDVSAPVRQVPVLHDDEPGLTH